MIVCHCKQIKKQDVDAAVDRGAKTYYDVSRITTAGRGCGSCAPLIVDILTTG